MFEAQQELESRSSVGEFLVIAIVIIMIGGVIGFAIYQRQEPLTADHAKLILDQTLKAKPPAQIHFHVGKVTPSLDENPLGPHYKLLEKLGLIELSHVRSSPVYTVSLTPSAEKQLAAIPDFERTKNPDGTDGITLPLARRELIEIKGITIEGPTLARVDYVWMWSPNPVGKEFNASSRVLQTFNQWDRAALIEKHGVDFYGEQHADFIRLARSGKNRWKVATE